MLTTAKILDFNVTTTKLASGAVTAQKLGPDSVTWRVHGPGAHGLDESILTASLRAVVSAANRHRADQQVVARREP